MKSFTNRAVVAVPASDPINPLVDSKSIVVHQDEQGPSYIAVGEVVTDTKLRDALPKLTARYGVSLEQLQHARAGERVEVRTAEQV